MSCPRHHGRRVVGVVDIVDVVGVVDIVDVADIVGVVDIVGVASAAIAGREADKRGLRFLSVDPTRLDDALRAEFESSAADRRIVVRQATDLAASGTPEADRGVALRVDDVIEQLRDAPDGSDLVDRWNWWLGALDLAYGGYRAFTVRARADTTDFDR